MNSDVIITVHHHTEEEEEGEEEISACLPLEGDTLLIEAAYSRALLKVCTTIDLRLVIHWHKIESFTEPDYRFVSKTKFLNNKILSLPICFNPPSKTEI
jgi:hypothetical protein